MSLTERLETVQIGGREVKVQTADIAESEKRAGVRARTAGVMIEVQVPNNQNNATAAKVDHLLQLGKPGGSVQDPKQKTVTECCKNDFVSSIVM